MLKLKENLLNIGKLNFYHHRSKLSTPKSVLKVWIIFLFLLIYVNIFKLNRISFRLVRNDFFT